MKLSIDGAIFRTVLNLRLSKQRLNKYSINCIFLLSNMNMGFCISQDIYSSLTLVLAICEGSHISPRNKFSSYLTLYIVPHIPKALGICEKNFKDYLWKIYFVEFIGFMVCKTTGSISRSFLLKKIVKKCFVSRDICKISQEKWSKMCKNLWIQGIFFAIFFQQE